MTVLNPDPANVIYTILGHLLLGDESDIQLLSELYGADGHYALDALYRSGCVLWQLIQLNPDGRIEIHLESVKHVQHSPAYVSLWDCLAFSPGTSANLAILTDHHA